MPNLTVVSYHLIHLLSFWPRVTVRCKNAIQSFANKTEQTHAKTFAYTTNHHYAKNGWDPRSPGRELLNGVPQGVNPDRVSSAA